MLWVCSNLQKYSEFKKEFSETRKIIDLSKVPSSELAKECESVLDHHVSCAVFLGYLEPGWMLDATHQTRIRKLFRKFDVAVVTKFVESIPHSWKTEIHTFYI